MLLLRIVLIQVMLLSYEAHKSSKKPFFKKCQQCCPLPNIISEDIAEQCHIYERNTGLRQRGHTHEIFIEMDSMVRKRHRPPESHCGMTCFLRVAKILDQNDAFQLDKVEDYLRIYLAEQSGFIEFFNDIFNKCYNTIVEFESMMNESPPPLWSPSLLLNGQCHPRYAHMMKCVFREAIHNCPDSIWLDTRRCVTLREKCTRTMDVKNQSKETTQEEGEGAVDNIMGMDNVDVDTDDNASI